MQSFGELLAGVPGGDQLAQKFGRDSLAESLQAMAQSYQSAEQRVHGSVQVPSEGASEEEWANFMSKVGAPASPAGYKAPEGVDEGVHSRAAEMANQANMTQLQYERVVKRLQSDASDASALKEKAVGELKAKYGEDFGAAEARVNRAIHSLGDQGKSLGDASRDPSLFQVLDKLGGMMSDDTLPHDTTIPGPREASQKELTELAHKARTIMESGDMDRGSPNYAQSNNEYHEIMTKLISSGFDSAFDPRLMNPFDPYLRMMGHEDEVL